MFWEHNVRPCFENTMFVYVLRTQWSSMFWEHNVRPCFENTMSVHVLRRQCSSMFWEHNIRPCFEKTMFVHVLRTQCSSMIWEHNVCPCFENTMFVHVLRTQCSSMFSSSSLQVIRTKHLLQCLYRTFVLVLLPLRETKFNTHVLWGFPCFFLSCKANARVKPAKTGHCPSSS